MVLKGFLLRVCGMVGGKDWERDLATTQASVSARAKALKLFVSYTASWRVICANWK